jgi:hypothetical protein
MKNYTRWINMLLKYMHSYLANTVCVPSLPQCVQMPSRLTIYSLHSFFYYRYQLFNLRLTLPLI